VQWNQAYFWIFLSLVCQVLSLILSKVAALRMHSFSLLGILHNGPYFASILCLGLQAIIWPLALRRLPLLKAYLFMSGLYIFIPPIAFFYFHEPVTGRNLLGSLVIMTGIGMLLTGGRDQSLG
jgi:drug/metabolite transporter (DMT)-like permease